MQALVHDPQAPHSLRIGVAPDPVPAPTQVLVQVTTVSINFGEIAFPSAGRPPGHVSGWDAAGVVVQAAADGSGPPAGTRVVTFGWSGAWAELRAVDTDNLAVVPEDVDLGLTAALRRLGSVIGRRVLVTGASGGVGRFAVQLAARAGAHVIASVGGPARAHGLRELGAAEIVFGPSEVSGRVYGVLDNVGGSQLAQAYNRLENGGVAQAIGMASREPTLIDFEEARTRVDRGRLETFNLAAPLGDDLAHLVTLMHTGALIPQIGWRSQWDTAIEAAETLLARRVPGKALLDLPPRQTATPSRTLMPDNVVIPRDQAVPAGAPRDQIGQ